MNDTQFTPYDEQKIFSTIFLVQSFFFMNSNSFNRVRVQKIYFFEFGKKIEFFQVRVVSPAYNSLKMSCPRLEDCLIFWLGWDRAHVSIAFS